jgi:hypothetical protein
MEPPVLNVIKRMNATDEYLKLILSGGDVLNYYFDGPQIFKTHDFDIKLSADKRVVLNQRNIETIQTYASEVAEEFEKAMSDYYRANQEFLDGQLRKLFGVQIARHRGSNERFKTFKRNDALHTIRYRLRNPEGTKEDVDDLLDVYVALPETTNFSFDTWIGGDELLSLDNNRFFVPTIEVEGILITGLGFMLWDTQRMIEYSREQEKKGKPNKLQRYIDKQRAMYNDLNHPLKRLKCLPFESYVKSCSKKFSRCRILNQRFNSVSEALDYSLRQDLISPEQRKILLQGNYSLAFICDHINRLLEYES